MSKPLFNLNEIKQENLSGPFYDSISNINDIQISNKSNKYKLYPTWNLSTNGRKYVALSDNLIITDIVRKQYNLI